MLAAMTVVVVERIAQVAIEKPMRARVGDSMSTRPLGLVGGSRPRAAQRKQMTPNMHVQLGRAGRI